MKFKSCLILKVYYNLSQRQMNQALRLFKTDWHNVGPYGRIMQLVGSQTPINLDPFLLLDYANMKLPGGFAEHPHRGFEAVMYVKEGGVFHQDFKGHKGEIETGAVQWMTAGKGIVHIDLPNSYDKTLVGFQLWINLRSDLKLVDPHYQYYTATKMPVVEKHNAKVKLISGKWEGAEGPVVPKNPVSYFDVEISNQGEFNVKTEQNWSSFIFVYAGELTYLGQKVSTNQLCVLSNQSDHKFESNGASLLYLSGKPLNEPIARKGPFVMNTEEQIEQAYKDLESRTNGFQNAGWKSQIGELKKKTSF